MNEWQHFRKIDWNDPKFNIFNVDARDFHCGYLFQDKPHEDWSKLKKCPDFFHTVDQLKELIERLFSESGGEAEWRMMDLDYNDPRVKNWNLKYLRIYRTELGFMVCNSSHTAISKRILSAPVDQKYLHTH